MSDSKLEPIEFGGTLPKLYSALIIQLVLRGALEPEDLDMIATRLDAEDMPNPASSVRALMLDVAIEAEHELWRLEGTDGGNDDA